MGCKYVLNPKQGAATLSDACDFGVVTIAPTQLHTPALSFKKLDKHGEVKVSATGSFYIRALDERNRIINGSEVTVRQ